MSRSSASRSSMRPAGMPSTIAVRPGPWDSPAVVKRKAVMSATGYRRGVVRRWTAPLAPDGGPHRLDVGVLPGPDSQRQRPLLDEHLEAVDGGRPGGLGGGEQRARLLGVDHVEDDLTG